MNGLEKEFPFFSDTGFRIGKRNRNLSAGQGVQIAVDELSLCSQLDFTRRFATAWEGVNYCVAVHRARNEHPTGPVG